MSAASSDAAHLKVFTYSYSSGGTRGIIHRSVFQWKNQAGKLFAYSLGEEGGYEEIYRLVSPGRQQYLLLSNERGIARLVELKGDYLLLCKAFDNQPTVDICNVELNFEAHR